MNTLKDIFNIAHQWMSDYEGSCLTSLDVNSGIVDNSTIILFDLGEMCRHLLCIPMRTFDIGQFNMELYGKWTDDSCVELIRKTNTLSWHEDMDSGLSFILSKISHYNKFSILSFQNFSNSFDGDGISIVYDKNKILVYLPIGEGDIVQREIFRDSFYFDCISDLLNSLKRSHKTSATFYEDMKK